MAGTRWVTTAHPAAELRSDELEPRHEPDGTLIYYFRTATGRRFAKVVEANGFTFWMQEVTT